MDNQKRLLVGAGINTRDYRERVPELVAAGADILCIDSSDGYSEWQADTIKFVKEEYNGQVLVGAGNVVASNGFLYLVEHGADFVKVGIGPGSICITREQKGIGRGQASALVEISRTRDKYYQEKNVYIPICSDGGIFNDYQSVVALAVGADFLMMGRYFARFNESPGNRVSIGGTLYKEYWAEGTNKASNWQRYELGGESKLQFEEGVEGYVPFAGKLSDGIKGTIARIKSTFCNCGCLSIEELHRKARLVTVSSLSIRESGAHDVILNENVANNTRRRL